MVSAAEQPVAAKVTPEYTLTPGAQVLLYGVAVNPQGVDEASHVTAFTMLQGDGIARMYRTGCSPEDSECTGTVPDMVWLFTDAPGQVVVQAEVDGLTATGTITVRTVEFASVIAGGHSCGVTTGDELFCWGGPFQPNSPILQARPGYTQVQVVGERTCGLDAAGLAQCWLVRGDTVPQPVSTTRHFTRLSLSSQTGCGLEATGKAWCWGENGSGQLGNGTKNFSATPVAVAGGLAFAEIATSDLHTCALTAAGETYCWGSNGGGQLGVMDAPENCGAFACSSTPLAAAAGHTFERIHAGTSYSCGHEAAGSLRCWGHQGRIGVSTPTGPPGTIESVAGGAVYISVSAGPTHVCAVRSDGRAFCWGENRWGQTGQAPESYPRVPTPVAGNRTFTSIAAGGSHSCGITTEGAYCWGQNGNGELGAPFGSGPGPVRVAGQE